MQEIRRCEWEEGRHTGKWIVQTYHETGMRYADELCPHYQTRKGAREAQAGFEYEKALDGALYPTKGE